MHRVTVVVIRSAYRYSSSPFSHHPPCDAMWLVSVNRMQEEVTCATYRQNLQEVVCDFHVLFLLLWRWWKHTARWSLYYLSDYDGLSPTPCRPPSVMWMRNKCLLSHWNFGVVTIVKPVLSWLIQPLKKIEYYKFWKTLNLCLKIYNEHNYGKSGTKDFNWCLGE